MIQEFENKLARIDSEVKRRFEIQKILVSKEGASAELINKGYFDKIITLNQIIAGIKLG